MEYLLSASPRIWASSHALGRMAEFGIDAAMVVETVTSPVVTWPAKFDRVHMGGARIIAVLAPETQTVVTVKLRTRRPYQHGVHTLTNLPDDLSSAA
jgi:hypothetical protein